eukprot:12895303-Prorocentrum_lima.AAC.1
MGSETRTSSGTPRSQDTSLEVDSGSGTGSVPPRKKIDPEIARASAQLGTVCFNCIRGKTQGQGFPWEKCSQQREESGFGNQVAYLGRPL